MPKDNEKLRTAGDFILGFLFAGAISWAAMYVVGTTSGSFSDDAGGTFFYSALMFAAPLLLTFAAFDGIAAGMKRKYLAIGILAAVGAILVFLRGWGPTVIPGERFAPSFYWERFGLAGANRLLGAGSFPGKVT